MKQRRVGCYTLGDLNVEVYLRDGVGGEFYFAPEPDRLPRIKVGADGTWQDCMRWLVHEAMEFELCAGHCRFQPDGDEMSSDRFIFHANHYQFSAACNGVGMFLSWCLPDLGDAWNKWQKPRKRKR